MIADAHSLAPLLHSLARAESVGVDTEADSLHSYFEKLCLLQVSVPGEDHLVDPLAGFDLSPLLQAMESNRVILHGADFDLRMLRRAGEFHPQRVFDTMIAARLTGLEAFSLAALVKTFFGVEMVKGSQKADWNQRPLPERMADYARNDTHYLIGLADRLEADLVRLGRRDWFEQTCQRVVQGSYSVKERDPAELWRIKGSAALHGRAAAILRSLWEWRDAEAQRMDRPAFKVLRNEDLLDSAAKADQGERHELRHLRGRRRETFEQALLKGLNTPEAEWPGRILRPRSKRDIPAERRAQALRTVRDRRGKELGLDPSVIAPKSALDRIGADESLVGELLLPWQRELLGL